MPRFLLFFAAAIFGLPFPSAAQVFPAIQEHRGATTAPAAPRPYQPQTQPAAIQSKLDQDIGRAVYSCHRTGLVLLDAKQRDGKPVLYYGRNVNPADLGYMSPWKVIGIDRLNDVAGWPYFGLRLVVNGSVMVINGIAIQPVELQSSPDILQTLANKVGLFTSIEASGIHFSDLHAVQTGKIHRGMSEQEVACALGTPDRSDLDNTGQRKDIYENGRLAVYIADGSVTSVQFHLPEPPKADAGQ